MKRACPSQKIPSQPPHTSPQLTKNKATRERKKIKTQQKKTHKTVYLVVTNLLSLTNQSPMVIMFGLIFLSLATSAP